MDPRKFLIPNHIKCTLTASFDKQGYLSATNGGSNIFTYNQKGIEAHKPPPFWFHFTVSNLSVWDVDVTYFAFVAEQDFGRTVPGLTDYKTVSLSGTGIKYTITSQLPTSSIHTVTKQLPFGYGGNLRAWLLASVGESFDPTAAAHDSATFAYQVSYSVLA